MQTTYYYFRLFQKSQLWEKLNTIIRERVRVKERREPQASAMIIDSQSVKALKAAKKSVLMAENSRKGASGT